MSTKGLDDDLVQKDSELATGFVVVTMAEGGIPSYDIIQPSAWDAIAADTTLLEVRGETADWEVWKGGTSAFVL